jgi:hypothetical protein
MALAYRRPVEATLPAAVFCAADDPKREQSFPLGGELRSDDGDEQVSGDTRVLSHRPVRRRQANSRIVSMISACRDNGRLAPSRG